MQKLMTEELAKTIPSLYTQEDADDPVVYAHLFSCLSGWDWYITELDGESGEAFGLVRGFEREWGYFSIPEMERANHANGFEVIERDEYFVPMPVSRIAD